VQQQVQGVQLALAMLLKEPQAPTLQEASSSSSSAYRNGTLDAHLEQDWALQARAERASEVLENFLIESFQYEVTRGRRMTTSIATMTGAHSCPALAD
jgi:hypothetical protein